MANSIRVDLGGPVHLMDHGGEGVPIVLIHGLGGSHVNWSAVAEPLTEFGAVTAIDLIGFGRTPPAGRSADVHSQRDLVIDYLRTFDQQAILIGNSMGGLVSLLVASKAPELVDSLVLVDPALPTVRLRWDREVAVSLLRPTIPVVGKRSFQKMAEDPQAYVDRLAKLLFVDHSRMADSDKEVSLAMAEERATMPWVAQAFSQASKSLLKVLVKRKAFAEMVTSIPVDALIVQGEQDRLVDVAAARWLHQQRPDWTLDVYPQVGHVPQLEVPAMFMDSVTKWRAAAAKGQPAAS